MRRINPGALTDAFTARIRQAEREHPLAVLVCDDMRAPDVGALTALGFDLVEVIAPEHVRQVCKTGRADLTAGDDGHPTEAPVDTVPWRRVDNAGDLEQVVDCVTTGRCSSTGRWPTAAHPWPTIPSGVCLKCERPDEIDARLSVSRTRQRRAIIAHRSQSLHTTCCTAA